MQRETARVDAERNTGAIAKALGSGVETLRSVGRFMRRKPLGAVGLVIVAVFILLAVAGDLIAPYEPNQMSRDFLRAPSLTHPFGTDRNGRDQLSRVIVGSRVSIYVGFMSVLVAGSIAAAVGIASAYYGGKLDLFVQRVVDITMAFPGLILAIAVMAALGQGLNNVVLAISIGWTPRILRIVRASAMGVKEEQYVQAAHALGARDMRIMWLHMFRNCTAPLLIICTGVLGQAIVTEATLSFLGLGVPPPDPTWGRMIAGAAQEYAERAPWMVIFPGVTLAVVVYGFNVLGDALRDVWDPRMRGT